MRTFFAKKIRVILLAVFAVVALMGLAVGLKNVSFRPAQSFGRNAASAPDSTPLELVNNVMSIPIKTQVIFWIMIICLVILFAMLISPEMRKQLLRLLLRMVTAYWVIYLLFTRYRETLAQIGMGLNPIGNDANTTPNGAPVPEFTPPQPVSWMTYLVSFGIAILLIILAWRLNAFWKQLNASAAESPIKKLAGIARSSLHDLSSGRDSTDVIMNCYFRMSEVVSDKKLINRNSSMTPSEFVIRLQQAGLPADPVRRLTRLFEGARYSGRKLDSTAVNEAVACLTTILNYCGEVV